MAITTIGIDLAMSGLILKVHFVAKLKCPYVGYVSSSSVTPRPENFFFQL
ncbi:hypothetical protein [Klebsiella aerogenes]|uniref:Uncharacterized protein n=1 Tax=Klebsiella aerogenes TaxID=548 RepID=A0AAP9R209_KLEAE|nr:hypothetical protein [Klebsiella aerogenes]QMR42975.1 hypothetical protein HV331_26145 [Klebsiella aerogenes]